MYNKNNILQIQKFEWGGGMYKTISHSKFNLPEFYSHTRIHSMFVDAYIFTKYNKLNNLSF